MVNIVQKDDPVLRKDAKAVSEKEFGSAKLHKTIKDMKNALQSQEDGVAIAAPQIGVALRMFVVSGKILLADDDTPGEDKVFINPEILKVSKTKEEMDEGCLSVRWKYGTVRRATHARVRAYDEDGNAFVYNGTGLLAQVFQHEVDHLNGVLFIDKAKNVREIDPEELKKGKEKKETAYE